MEAQDLGAVNMSSGPAVKRSLSLEWEGDAEDTLRMSRAELDELVRQSSYPPPLESGDVASGEPEEIDLSDESLEDA
jgi:hypothetical protein